MLKPVFEKSYMVTSHIKEKKEKKIRIGNLFLFLFPNTII